MCTITTRSNQQYRALRLCISERLLGCVLCCTGLHCRGMCHLQRNRPPVCVRCCFIAGLQGPMQLLLQVCHLGCRLLQGTAQFVFQ